MAHPVDIHVGRMIRERRLLKGMTQRQLAVAIGVRPQQINKYETAINRVSASRLWEMSRVLSVPAWSFFEGYEEGSVKRLEPDQVSVREAVSLLQSISAARPDHRRKLVDLARAMSKEV